MLLEKVQKPDQLPIFYAGGFKLLAAALAKSRSINWLPDAYTEHVKDPSSESLHANVYRCN